MRKETALHLSYDTRKLQALQYYLPQNGMSVEAAIIAHLDGIYDTQVPENVKEFLQHMGSEKTETASKQPVRKQAREPKITGPKQGL